MTTMASNPLSTHKDKLMELLENRVPYLTSSFEGTGQYSRGASSGCGLAALNAVRVVLGREKAGLRGLDLLRSLGRKKTTEEIIAIYTKWSNQFHLEADEIARLPLFESSLKLADSRYEEVTIGNIKKLLRDLKSISENHTKTSAAVVITRPPEIFTLFYIPTMNATGEGVFALFDSHPRPPSTTGSSFVLFLKPGQAGRYIFSLIQVDKNIRLEGLGWQGQLLGQFSGHHFRIRDNYELDAAPSKSFTYDADLKILQLRHTVQELKDKNKKLNGKVTTLQSCLQSQAQTQTTARSKVPDNVPGPIRLSPSIGRDTSKGKEKASTTKFSTPSSPGLRSRTTTIDNGSRPGSNKSTKHKGSTSSFNNAPEMMDDQILARLIQEDFNVEDAELRGQAIALVEHAIQRTFECTICFELHPYDSVALIETCGHGMCRECAKEYLDAKLEEGRYPIMCPMCQASKNVEDPGVITRTFLEQLSPSEEQVGIWYELELSELSIILDCPGCRRSTFVDRTDHTTMKLLTCPLPDCRQSWCKDCLHRLEQGDVEHSCDGSVEMDNLVRDSGWMYCPGCQTPTEKHTGCNHMTCVARGCNMHYCYGCREPIVRSAVRDTVEQAMREHYSRCQLFVQEQT